MKVHERLWRRQSLALFSDASYRTGRDWNARGSAQTSANAFFCGGDWPQAHITQRDWGVSLLGGMAQKNVTWTWSWAASSGCPCLSRDWTRWPPEVPSNLNHPVILGFLVIFLSNAYLCWKYLNNILFSLAPEDISVVVFLIWLSVRSVSTSLETIFPVLILNWLPDCKLRLSGTALIWEETLNTRSAWKSS